MIRDRLRSFRKQEDVFGRDETYEKVTNLLYFPNRSECDLTFIHDGKGKDVTIGNVEAVISDMKMCVDTFIITTNNLEFTFKPKKTVRVQGDMVIIKHLKNK